jgi:MazG family protein
MNEDAVTVATADEEVPSGLASEGRRFALAIVPGLAPDLASRASSVYALPDSSEELIDSVGALDFLTWVRFALRHYGSVVCLSSSELASSISDLLRGAGFALDGAAVPAERPASQAAALGSVLGPLLGSRYTAIEDFRLLVAELRQKCPWDREQTHVSLLDTLLEESYEVALAIQRGNAANLEEELGDLLLQVFIQSEIAREQDGFDICDVIRTEDAKLTFRHPHVFDDVTAGSSDQVLDNWQKLKALEGRKKHFVDSAKLLSSIENALLSQENARVDGFDFESARQAYGKLVEETEELGRELDAAQLDANAAAMELGDVLFSALNVARLLSINPVKALHASFDKFRDRYTRVQTYAREQQVDISTASADELERLWQLAKS